MNVSNDGLSSIVFATMKLLALTLIILLVSIYNLDAFLPSPRHASVQLRGSGRSRPVLFSDGLDNDSPPDALEHSNIIWKLRPAAGTSKWKQLWLRIAANTIRLDCKLKGQKPPLVLCPKGGQAVLEAHFRPEPSSELQKAARFGFTTERGPSNEPIQDTILDLYGIDKKYSVGVGAIVYMFVEPEYRKMNIGTLALEVISLIHAIQACDFTVLVADDDGSGKLIKWYEKHGYSLAPKLQDVLGSPNAAHGVAMIAPTQRRLPENLFLQWW